VSYGVYTQCYGNYHRYLPDWERMMAAVNGLDDAVVVGDAAARDAWQGFGRFVFAPEFGGPFRQAASANRAVENLDTEWVTHVGVDDLALPNLVTLTRPFVNYFDVVAYDNIHWSDGRVGERRRNVPSTPAILSANFKRATLDACAWFRRSLWVERPYDPEFEGAVDVAFWIKHAGAGARFVGSGELGILYRIHQDSLWHSRPDGRKRENRHRLNVLKAAVRPEGWVEPS
jgi:hypothetical protein